MLDAVRRYVRERFGKLAPKRTEELTRNLVKQGQATREQATRIARDVMEWSRKNREMVTEIVQREVRKQIARLAAATKEEVAAIRDRVGDLEKTRGGPKRAAARPAARRGGATKKSAAKKATVTKPAGKKTVAKKTTARKPDGKRIVRKKPASRKTARPAKRA